MADNILTNSEIDLRDRLPGPPAMAEFRVTDVWIIEWLLPGEQKTGKLLHDWIQEQRPGCSTYSPCKSKMDVFAAIEGAITRAQQSKIIPVLHLEAHGDEDGLNDGSGGPGLLRWNELTAPLQRLNLTTACNLVVFVAACTGFAAIKTFREGPRAPALALVGPDRSLTGSDILRGTKEFYRRWIDGCRKLDDIVDNASREVEPVTFKLEPFAFLAFDAMAKWLINLARPDEQHRHIESIRRRMRDLNKFTETEIERKLSHFSPVPSGPYLQRQWDMLFMIDLCPANRERFGVDMAAVLEIVLQHQERERSAD